MSPSVSDAAIGTKHDMALTLPSDKKHQTVYRHDDYSDDGHGEFPTDEEFHTLRRVSDKIPWRAYTIAFVELCERFSYYGTTVVCKLSTLPPL